MNEKYVSWEELTDEQKEMAIANYQDIRLNEGDDCSAADARKAAPCCCGFWVDLNDGFVTCNI